MNRLIKWVAVALSIGLLIGLGVSTVYRAGPYQFNGRTWGSRVHRTDFTVFRAAGQAVLEGTDIYKAQNVRGWNYVYPPPFAILMVPFAVVPVFWGALIWYLISVGFTAASVAMCVRMLRNGWAKDDDGLLLATVPMALLLVWFMPGLARGQTNALMLWLVVAALFCEKNGRDLLGAASLAGAALLKVFPVVLLVYFAWRRNWRFVAGTLVVILLLSLVAPAAVFGWQRNLAYLREWTQVVAQPALAPESERENSALFAQLMSAQKLRNQSLEPVLWRLTGGVGARPVAVGMGLAMAGMIGFIGRRAGRDNELLIASSVLTWMILAQPLAESHYFVLLLLPLTVLVSVSARHPEAVIRRVTRVVLVMFGLVSVCSAAIKPLQFYGSLCWATLAVWMVLLWVASRRVPSDRGGH